MTKAKKGPADCFHRLRAPAYLSLEGIGFADGGIGPGGGFIEPDEVVAGGLIEELDEAGLDSVLDGAGGQVIRQLPVAGALMNAGALVMLYVAGPTAEETSVTVPDVTGMPVTEANRLLKSYGLELQIEGSGLAVNQSPAAGTTVNPTTRVTVRFKPP